MSHSSATCGGKVVVALGDFRPKKQSPPLITQLMEPILDSE